MIKFVEIGDTKGVWIDTPHGLLCAVDRKVSDTNQDYVALYEGDDAKRGKMPFALTFNEAGVPTLQIPVADGVRTIPLPAIRQLCTIAELIS